MIKIEDVKFTMSDDHKLLAEYSYNINITHSTENCNIDDVKDAMVNNMNDHMYRDVKSIILELLDITIDSMDRTLTNEELLNRHDEIRSITKSLDEI
jgi:hypothetical protein